MKTNVPRKVAPRRTHEGAPAAFIGKELDLRRSVMATLLWEDQFYESGEDIATRIAKLVKEVSPEKVAAIAVEAREQMKLRHIPLFITREMARHQSHRPYVADTLAKIVQRPDELSEFLAMYWKDDDAAKREHSPLASSVKKGLARAFTKFNEYSLAKYNGDGAVKLRDVLFLVKPKPTSVEQAEIWKRLANKQLGTPDTWEVELSASKDKKASWTRLLSEGRLFSLALLRNLRNMLQAGVDTNLIRDAILQMETKRVLPFRFISAARYGVQFEPELEQAMFRCLKGAAKLPGRTILLVDVSGSMEGGRVSGKSEMTFMDAACALGMLTREVCEQVQVFSFSTQVVEVPPRRGFALRDAIVGSQTHGGTALGGAVMAVSKLPHDRLIVITDEQSADRVPPPPGLGYMINVASARNGVGYGAWKHIDGWSEAIMTYIRASEGLSLDNNDDATE